MKLLKRGFTNSPKEKNIMPNITRTVLSNYAIGFDSLFQELENIKDQFSSNYPPHNITKIDENNFKLSLAVAGFTKEDLSITAEDGLVSVKGNRDTKDLGKIKDKTENLYNGIAERAFYKRFKMSEHMEVVDSKLMNGILTLSLQREVPKEKQPKTIKIN
jgi:molecular chaperone IbpA